MKYLITWMGFHHGGGSERQHETTDDHQRVVELVDYLDSIQGASEVEVFHVGAPIHIVRAPVPKRPTLDQIIEGLRRVRPKDRMEVLRKLGFRRTTNADYYPAKKKDRTFCVWFMCDLDKGPCKCIQGQP